MLYENEISEVIRYFNKYCLAREVETEPPHSKAQQELKANHSDVTSILRILEIAEPSDFKHLEYGEELTDLRDLMRTIGQCK